MNLKSVADAVIKDLETLSKKASYKWNDNSGWPFVTVKIQCQAIPLLIQSHRKACGTIVFSVYFKDESTVYSRADVVKESVNKLLVESL